MTMNSEEYTYIRALNFIVPVKCLERDQKIRLADTRAWNHIDILKKTSRAL